MAELDEATKQALQEQAPQTSPGDTEEKPDVPGVTEQSGENEQTDLPDVNLKLDEVKDGDDNSSGSNDDTSAGADSDADSALSDLDKQTSSTLKDAGYNEEDLLERIKTDGGITDELVSELKQKINPDVVDAHVGRLRAEIELAKIKADNNYEEKQQAVQDMNKYIYDAVGGEKNFQTIAKLLVQEVPAKEVSRLDAKIQSGNKALVNEGLREMDAMYKKVRGMGGKLIQGGSNVETQQKVTHITKEEYRALMRTEKYKTDRAYADKVDADRLTTRQADEKRYGKGSYYGYHPTKGRYSL